MYIYEECVFIMVAEKAREEDSWPTGRSCTLLLSPSLHGISRTCVYFFFSFFFLH